MNQLGKSLSFSRWRGIVWGGGKGGGGGGGSSQPQQMSSQVTQSNIPEYARPYFESLMGRAEGVSNEPYQAYTGPRIAPFSEPQTQAFQNVQSNQGVGNANLNQAQAAMSQGSFDPTAVTNTYGAQAYNPNAWVDSGVASRYMSPYMQNVTDIAKREAMRDFGIQQQGRNSQAQQAGAFGGYRHQLVDAEANRNLNEQLQDIQARGLQSAYDTGLNAFNQDRSAFIGANQLNNQFAQQQAQLGMAAQGATNQYGLQAADQLQRQAAGYQGLGALRQQMGLTDANSLLNIGAMQQAQNQNQYDVAYQDFISQRDYPRQNLNWLSGILRGVPVSANSSVVQYQTPPSTVSQLTGLGLGAAGLMKAFS